MRPEHLYLSGLIFLPITLESCQALLADESARGLLALSDPELAALLVIQNLAASGDDSPDAAGAERILAKLIGWALDGNKPGNVSLLNEAQRLLDLRKLYFGLEVIKESRLRLLSASEVAECNYLMSDGNWDFQFKFRHALDVNPFKNQFVIGAEKEHWFTGEQDKIVRVFQADSGEDLHIQGYAGIGKSYLLGALADCIHNGEILVLASTPEKLRALQGKGGWGSRGRGVTYTGFARRLLGLRGSAPQVGSSNISNKSMVARELGGVNFRELGAAKTLEICSELLVEYCKSGDYTISKKHIPYFVAELSPLEAAVLVEYSSRLWTYLGENSHLLGGELYGLSLIKKANLAGVVAPKQFSHVIVDESQDLPRSLLNIIERGRQVIITLGDEYQDHQRERVRRGRDVRSRDIVSSVRCGRPLERMVNPIIDTHGRNIKVPFEGSRNVKTDIVFYQDDLVPSEGSVVLTASLWDSMKWAIYVAGFPCLLNLADRRNLSSFMSSAIDFYYGLSSLIQEDKEESLHPYFLHVKDWAQLKAENEFDQSFLWVEARLGAGYRKADLNSVSVRQSVDSTSVSIILARDVGGREFDSVILTPELMTNVKFKHVYDFDSRLCDVYIALSRARRQIYLPKGVEGWVSHHRGNFRESYGY